MDHLKFWKKSINITSIQSAQQDARKFGIPPRAESATNHPIFIKENSPSRALFLKKLKCKVFDTHTPRKNKHFKG